MITNGTGGTLVYPANSDLCRYVLGGYCQPLACVAWADQFNGFILIRTKVFGEFKILNVPAVWFQRA